MTLKAGDEVYYTKDSRVYRVKSVWGSGRGDDEIRLEGKEDWVSEKDVVKIHASNTH